MTGPEYQPRHVDPEAQEPQLGDEVQRAIPLDRERWPPEPGIWIAADVDSHHGVWLDATASPEELQEEIADGYIYDSIGFGGFVLDPDEDPVVVVSVARGIAEHGMAFAAWAELHDADAGMLAAFQDHYLGYFTSYAEFGRNLVGALGWDIDSDVPPPLRPWIQLDYEGIGRAEIEQSRLIAIPADDGGLWTFHFSP